MKTNIIITSSKIYAFACLLVGCFALFYGEESNAVLMLSIPIGAGLMANKQYNDRKKDEKSDNNRA